MPETVPALAALTLVDDDEKPVRVGDLWLKKPMVLAFLRHWG